MAAGVPALHTGPIQLKWDFIVLRTVPPYPLFIPFSFPLIFRYLDIFKVDVRAHHISHLYFLIYNCSINTYFWY